jgi:two-component system sensor histidine kinase RegB
MHLQGMWIAFAIAAALTAHFVVQLSAAIDRRDAEILAARDRAARSERLAALATLAAGAAHELATPLGTIAIAAKELERALARLPAAEAGALLEDAGLSRAELERCRRILDQMAARSGETTGEVPETVSVKGLLDDVLNDLPPEDAARVDVSTISV